MFGIDSIGRICFRIDSSSYFSQHAVAPGLPSSPLLFDGNCHHVAVQRNLNELRFYIDGIFVSSSLIPSNTSLISGGLLRIGLDNIQWKTGALNGSLDYLRIWNYAVKDADIFNNRLSYTGNVDSTQIAGWYFHQNPDTIVYDHSPYLHHGLIIRNYSTPVNNGPAWLTVTCGSEEGNSFVPEPASDPACINNPDPVYCNSLNLICNGDFEQENSSPGSFPNAAFGGCTAAGSSNEVVNWCSTNGIPSYFGRNPANPNYGLPANLYSQNDDCAGIVDTWNGALNGNDHYAVLNYFGSNLVGNMSLDEINTVLTAPLTAGSSYTLRFRALCSFDPNFQDPALLTTSIKFEIVNSITSIGMGIGEVIIPTGCGWNQYQLAFTAPVNPAGLDKLRVKVTGTNNLSSHYFFYVDDFEIFEARSDYPVWLSGTGSQRPQEVTTDPDGNSYIAGFANQEIIYPGGLVQGIANTVTGFVASFDPCGNLRWAHNTNLSDNNYVGVRYSATQQGLYAILKDPSGLSICLFDPATGLVASTLPFPGITSSTTVLKTKYYNATDEWYILTQDEVTGFYTMFYYSFAGNSFLFSNPLLGSGIALVDFSIQSLSNLCLIFNTGSLAYLQYPASRLSLTGGTSYNVVNTGINGTVHLRSIDQNNAGIACIGGDYEQGDVTVNGIQVASYTTPSVPGYFTNGFTFLFDINTNNVIANSGRYFGNDGLSRVTEIACDANGDFIISGTIGGSDFTGPLHSNLSNPLLPNPHSRGFYVSKINGATGDDVWVQQGITSGIGQWTQHLTLDAHSSIFLTGYLSGSIDFLQGDTWNSVVECDNTYLVKVRDGNNLGVIERQSNSNNLLNINPDVQLKNKVFILNEWSDLFVLNPMLFNQSFCIYDMMGKEIYSGKGVSLNGEVLSIHQSGMYVIRATNSNQTIRFIISR